MRSPSAFDNDATIQEHVKSGKARLFKGDALNIEDARAAWAEASRDKPVDLFLSTVGFCTFFSNYGNVRDLTKRYI